jgi:hypothetical protein
LVLITITAIPAITITITSITAVTITLTPIPAITITPVSAITLATRLVSTLFAFDGLSLTGIC